MGSVDVGAALCRGGGGRVVVVGTRVGGWVEARVVDMLNDCVVGMLNACVEVEARVVDGIDVCVVWPMEGEVVDNGTVVA